MIKRLAFLGLLLLASPAFCDGENQGKFPFLPSLVTTVTGQPSTPSEFYSSDRCRSCHAALFNQWKGSMHSLAVKDPVFLALWKKADEVGGPGLSNLCAGCHTAVSVVSKAVEKGPDGNFVLPSPGDEGVHCHMCHSVTGTSMKETPTGLPQNASIILDPKGPLMRGPFADAKPMWHKAEYDELFTKAEFCGNCHNVFHPMNNFHIENTYTEWKFSVYAQNGIICQDCHMMPVELAAQTAKTMKRPKNPGKASPMGPARENIFTHEFVGANFTVTKALGGESQAAIAVERLKSAATLELKALARAAGEGLVRVKVKVINSGAGHNLPTSLTEVRQMWVDFKVTDKNGAVVYRSGAIDEKGDLAEDSVVFNSSPVDKDGHHTHLPWEMARFDYNRTIPPKGYAEPEYSFVVPKGARGPLDVTATLRYRSYPQSLANELLGDKTFAVPVVDMVQAGGRIELE